MHEGSHLCRFCIESLSSKFRGCFIFFKRRSYLSSSILPGVFSHDKSYLHIIYIYRFAAFPCATDIFYRFCVSLLLPSSSSHPFLPSFYRNSNTITFSLYLSPSPHLHYLCVTLPIKFLQTKPFYSEAPPDPAPPIFFFNQKNRLTEIGFLKRQGQASISQGHRVVPGQKCAEFIHPKPT